MTLPAPTGAALLPEPGPVIPQPIIRVSPPSIVQQPLPVAVNPGSNVTFTVVAQGTAPLAYQWQVGGENLPDATNATLMLSNVQPVDSGIYLVRVTNDYGTAVSDDAELVVFGAPVIVRQPQATATVAGSNVLFSVVVQAAPPVAYQWRFNGANLDAETNPVLVVSNITALQTGTYSVAVSNSYGVVTSVAAELTVVDYVDDQTHFQIDSLTTAGSRAVEHAQVTGDDRGGIAASASRLFVTGDGPQFDAEGLTGSFALHDLSDGTPLGVGYNFMMSDIRTETVYVPATGDVVLPLGGGTITSLLAIDGDTGLLTARRINLTLPISAVYGSGFFAGYGHVVIRNHFGQVYSIQTPSGFVSYLGQMNSFNHNWTESSVFFGVAEKVDGVVSLVYAQDYTTIVRRRVPDGLLTTLATFSGDFGISDMASITVSPRYDRWYFHHESWSVFRNRQDNIDETVGYAAATFTIDSGIHPIGYVWGPLDGLQPANAAIPVTLTALTSSQGPAIHFDGVVRLSATDGQGLPVPLLPTAVSNFVDGTWSGTITVLQAADQVIIRAEDEIGLVGFTPAITVSSTDFGVFISGNPNPVSINQPLTYSVRVMNTGPGAATGVWLTNFLPAEIDLVEVTASQGTCTPAGDQIVCELGTLDQAATAVVNIQVIPAVAGRLTNTVAVVRNEADPNPANNTAAAVIAVTAPPLVVDDVEATEGDAGTGTVTFDVRLLYPTTNTVTVSYTTANGTADSTRDFTAASGSLTFGPNVTTQSVVVTIKNDTTYEHDEAFSLILHNPVNAVLGDGEGTCIIRDNDPLPTLSVADVTVVEGDSGTNLLSFTVRLSATPGVPVTVRYATSNATATADSDFVNKSGEIVFLAHFPLLSRAVHVPVMGDIRAEPDETLEFHVFDAVNGLIGRPHAIGTIQDDDLEFAWDPLPAIQAIDVPIAVTVRAQRYGGTLVETFNETAVLQALVGAPLVPGTLIGDITHLDFGPGDLTIGYDFTLADDIRVTHVRHYTGTKVTVWRADGALVFSQNVTGQAGSWRQTPLPTPIWLQQGQTYRIAYYTGGNAGNLYVTLDRPAGFPYGTLSTNGFYRGGDGYPDNEIPATAFYGFVDLAYEAGQPPIPIPLSPGVSGTFVNGVWSGEIRVLQPGSNVVLRATADSSHFGQSLPLDILPVIGADLAVEVSPSANPVPAGSRVVFKWYVTNHGPLGATNVVLTNLIPAGLELVSAWSSQGTVTNDENGMLLFELGSLPQGGSSFIATEFQADAEGTFTNAATVVAPLADADPANNHAAVTLAVCADCDEDGIPDDWEWTYGLDPRDPTDAALDPDGDGLTNLEEYQNGTNPFFNDLPVILAEPQDQGANTGDTVTFGVVAEGTEPLSYTWLHYGEVIPDATNTTLVLSNVSFAAGGPYVARVANPYGTAFTRPAHLTLDTDRTFRILEMTGNNVIGTDVNNLIGDDRGGIAVTTNRVLLTGDNDTGIWNLQTLGGGTGLGNQYDSLVSDLQTGVAYVLADGETLLTGSGRADTLIALDPANGSLTTNRITLSTAVALSNGSGIFAGYGCIVLYNSNNRLVSHVDLPSGNVSELGQIPFLSRQGTENWAFWGIAEYFGGSIHLVYVRDSQSILRTRVPDGLTTVLAAFNNLSDMASITFSPVLSRWFFHHEGSSELFDGSEVLGSAEGRFTVDAGHPFVRGIEGEPVGFQATEISLRVLATGAEPLQYQWWLGEKPLADGTNATFTLTNAQPGDSGTYSVVVSNSAGFDVGAFDLQVLGTPVITRQPEDRMAAADSFASFLVEVEGAPPLSFQWLYNGAELPGATNALLELANVTTNAAGSYAVRISNRFGTVLSASAELEVVEAGQFTDDFEPGIDLIQWLEFGGIPGETVQANNYGGHISGANSLWFGNDGSRYATSRALNTLSGGSISFWIRLSDGNGQPWEQADIPSEGVVFEFSVDGGSSWTVLRTMDTTEYFAWTGVTLPVPPAAQSSGTLFRWRQLQNSGSCCDHWALDDVAILTGPTPPTIITQPFSQTVLAGGSASLQAIVSGTMPLTYQWRFNSTDLPDATNAVLQFTNFQADQAGAYSVFITNIHGSALSEEAILELGFDDLTQFRIVALTTNNSATIDHNNLTSDDRGGIATSQSHVYITGDGATARFALADLSGGARIGDNVRYDSLITDFRTQTIYLLANNESPLNGQGTVNALLELDSATGRPSGRRIQLSQSINMGGGAGVFSGYARALLYTGTEVYSIQLPAGIVINLGTMPSFNHTFSENWAFWGIAERVAQTNYLVFVENSQRIVRRRVPDGEREILLEAGSLGDMASITVSLPYGRWYFHHESSSLFSPGGEILGYADANFEVDSGVYATRYAWEPIRPLKPTGTPFTVTLSALNSTDGVVSNYVGSVNLTARTLGGLTVPIQPTHLTNFVNGTWTGEITLPQPALDVTLVATDDTGATGVSNPFNATNEFALVLSVTPNPVTIGANLTNSLQIINAGPGPATGIRLTNPIPAHVDVISTTTSAGGSCLQVGDQILCDLPDLAVDTAATVEIVIRPALAGFLTNTFAVHRNEPDPNPANNIARFVATVLGPPLVIDDVAVAEGNTGTTPAIFTVRLLQPTTNTVTVQYATANGTATGGRDFTQRTGLLTFPPTVTTQTLTVTISGDTRYEFDETFPVTLSNPNGASLQKEQAICTILDDDPMPTLSISDATIVEADSGSANITFTIRLSAVPGVPVSVTWTNASGTADAGIDYANLVGSMVFPADFIFLSRNVNIPVYGDTAAEADETFTLHLVDPVNATLADAEGVGTIHDNDIQFVWNPISSPQPVNSPFPVTIRAQTYDGTLVTTFNETVTLSASKGAVETNQIGTGTITNTFPISVSLHDERTQLIYLASEIGRAGPIAALALDVTQPPALSLENWTIRLKHTALTRYTSPYQWEASGWTVVTQGTVTVTGSGWIRFDFATPFPYDGTNNLMVDFSYRNNQTTGTQGWCRNSTVTGLRTLTSQVMNYWGYLPPLQWSGDGSDGLSPYPSLYSRVPNLGVIFDTLVHVPASPVLSGNFQQGEWSGTVQVIQTNSSISLTATSATDHSGRSNPFDVQFIQQTDIAVTTTAPTNQFLVGSNLTLRLTITNHGPNLAPLVLLSNPVPAGLTFVSATANRGSVTNANNQVLYSLLSLASGSAAEINVTFRGAAPGLVTNTAGLRSNMSDSNPANNLSHFALEVLCSDCDGDGMLDLWELEHGFDPTDPTDADEDADGDQMTNREEFLAGTDPNDSQDVLVLQYEQVAGSPDVSLLFTGKENHKYALERAQQATGPWTPIALFKLGTLPTVRLTDFGAAAGSSFFYRVRVLP